MEKKTVFAFDVGLASLGVAVNVNDDIKEAKSLLIHATAGCTKEQAARRGAYRMRRSHKEREKRLEEFWLKNVGEEGFLQRKSFEKKNGKWRIKTKADQRLEKEFPSKNEGDITYASSLLRIQLLEGEKLEKWQIYKALHASIQRRGYDDNVPWKNRETQEKKNKPDKKQGAEDAQNKKNDSEKEYDPEEAAREFEDRLRREIKDSKYHYPCYLDAYLMGLWDNKKGIISIRQKEKDIKGKSAYTASRKYVEKELAHLLKAAAKQIPQLIPFTEVNNLNQFLWGKRESGSLSDRYPSEKRIGGLLAQKYPRFDNRIVSKCCLIHRLNVCKSSTKLAIEVNFLLRLCNFRYEAIDEAGKKNNAELSRKQIKTIFDKCCADWDKNNKGEYNAEEYSKCFKLTKTGIKNEIKKIAGENELKEGHLEIEASKTSGRSRYSRPTLYVLKKLILSEQTPIELYKDLQERIVTQKPQSEFGYKLFDERPYLYQEDDFWFLKEMGNKIYIPDMTLLRKYGFDIDETNSVSKNEFVSGIKDPIIQRVINSCNWPVVRHRLGVFYKELKNLVQEHGKPDAVHIEFVREDFISNKRKIKYQEQSRVGKKKHTKAIEILKRHMPSSSISQNDIKKCRLFEEQRKSTEQHARCPYTGTKLHMKNLRSYEIDHIFPQGSGGPDAFYNIVLTTRSINEQKGNRLPCECDFIDWNSYRNTISNNKKNISEEKRNILLASTRDEAMELVEKYTPLHATSYIARLARDIACLCFNWQPGAKDEDQKVFVFSGAITSRIAKKYELYQILGNGKLIYTKNREDDRHHALDAIIISYLRQYTRDQDKAKFFKLPRGKDNYEYFSKKLAKVYPHHITHTKPALTEEPYRAWKKEKLTKIENDRKKAEKDLKKKGQQIRKRKLTDKKEARNLSKDPNERGQWYQNKRTQEEGVFQHGYLFYFDRTSNKFRYKSIHSYDSPYRIKKMLERKGHEIHELFYSKQTIQIGEQDTQITGTRIGRALPYIQHSIYKIEKINKGHSGESILRNLENEELKIRIKSTDLYKINLINNLLNEQPFKLDRYLIKTKDNEEQELTGQFKFKRFSKKSIVDCSNNKEYWIDNFDKLINGLYIKNQNQLSEMLKQGDLIQLGRFLPYIKEDGKYTIIKEANRYSLENSQYTINTNLPALIKLKLIEKHLIKQEPFELDNYLMSEEQQLTGRFKISKLSWNKNSASITDCSNNNEHQIDIKYLLIHLSKNQTEELQYLLKEQTITVKTEFLPSEKGYLPKYRVRENDLPKQKIEPGQYLLKNKSDEKVTITSQDGTDYRVKINILKYAKPIS